MYCFWHSETILNGRCVLQSEDETWFEFFCAMEKFGQPLGGCFDLVSVNAHRLFYFCERGRG